MPPLDHDRCYAAAASRDARFDGHFVTAVRTTGIYCRPSCPAITPKRRNVEFHPTPAAAQQRGFRACKRCLPDATPGSPEWNTRGDVVGRAMRLIADGEVERSGVGGLARRLGYSSRHLTRLMTDDLGAGPLAIARAQRAHTARILIETTPMRLTDVAFAAGFGSVRQFNDTVREVYAASPSELRGTMVRPGPAGALPGSATTLRLRLPYRRPCAIDDLSGWFAARCVPGFERVQMVDDQTTLHTRALSAPSGSAVVSAEFVHDEPSTDRTASIAVTVRLEDPSDLGAVVHRVRRMYDLDADPVAIDARLGADPMLARSVADRPGVRSPGSVDPFETAVRAVIGQQVSVAAARTVTATLVAACGAPLTAGFSAGVGVERTFPDAASVADAPDRAFSMPTGRRDTIRRLAAAVAAGSLELDIGADGHELSRQLLAVRGIGPWTAGYVSLRGLSNPDVLLDSDLVVARTAARRGLGRSSLVDHAADHWAPWRSYATHHLWAMSASDIMNRTSP